jgi:HEAT repeat protein
VQRRHAAWALGRIGAEQALPALRDARFDTDPLLRRAAAEAIRHIQAASKPPRLTEPSDDLK